MILPDANLLLYAYHPRAEQHEASRNWLEAALSGSELVQFPWLTLWAFLGISTNPRAFEEPLSIARELGISRTAVHQAEANAIRSLRKMVEDADSGRLQPER